MAMDIPSIFRSLFRRNQEAMKAASRSRALTIAIEALAQIRDHRTSSNDAREIAGKALEVVCKILPEPFVTGPTGPLGATGMIGLTGPAHSRLDHIYVYADRTEKKDG